MLVNVRAGKHKGGENGWYNVVFGIQEVDSVSARTIHRVYVPKSPWLLRGMHGVSQIAAPACCPQHQRQSPSTLSVSRGQISPATTESLIYPFQELDEPPMAILVFATCISGMHAVEPSLRLLAASDGPAQVLQQAAVRMEIRITTNYLRCFYVGICPLDRHGRLVFAAGLMRAGGEEFPELELVAFRDCGKEEFFHEHTLEAVVPGQTSACPSVKRRVELVY